MTQFEKITESPEVLGAFLAALPVVDGPWDKEFHERYCADCLYLGCDACPHEEFRNNPGWWLTLGAGLDVEPGTVVIDIDPAEAERPLTAEEEAEMKKVAPIFRYAIESGTESGVIKIMPMGGREEITLYGDADVQQFINHLLDSRRKT